MKNNKLFYEGMVVGIGISSIFIGIIFVWQILNSYSFHVQLHNGDIAIVHSNKIGSKGLGYDILSNEEFYDRKLKEYKNSLEEVTLDLIRLKNIHEKSN